MTVPSPESWHPEEGSGSPPYGNFTDAGDGARTARGGTDEHAGGRRSIGRVSRVAVAAGTLTAVCLAMATITYFAYRIGRVAGAESERRRMRLKEGAIQAPPLGVPAAPGVASGTAGRDGATDGNAGPAGISTADRFVMPPDGIWCFGPEESVRAVWPMEIVEADGDCDRPHFRIRQGANALCTRGTGLCEFAFATARHSYVSVWVRVRYSDDCGNSLQASVNGGSPAVVGNRKVYDRWLWEPAHRLFACPPGLHRLTIGTSEDGLLFDRVAIVPMDEGFPLKGEEHLDALRITPPPEFERLPSAGPRLPAIGRLWAGAFAPDSLVIGSGHRNTILLAVRLNGSGSAEGRARVSGRAVAGGVIEKSFRLDAARRTAFIRWDLRLRPRSGYFQPVLVTVEAGGETICSQELNFIRPLPWAFLGPFRDEEGRGLRAELPPDWIVARLHELPAVEGAAWKIVEDGSCYDWMGVVDLNRVFGFPNERWRDEGAPGRVPMVAYAVTCILGMPEDHHNVLAFAGDDAVRVWRNGEMILDCPVNSPLETKRQIVGVPMRGGKNFFVFKVPQTDYYWSLLFEPETNIPYGRQERFEPLQVRLWKGTLRMPFPFSLLEADEE
ncbi:MAG: hypothetical protein N3A38_04255 [Planctomycetota bacterium]|nr:hypothetical protein [Planctomycetota bacterium]